MIIRAFHKPQQSPVMPKAGRRAPSNVPYVIDNIWEWLRPLQVPSRRNAVFASPTAALARKCADMRENEGNTYSVELPDDWNVTQIKEGESPFDARYHPDIRSLRKLVIDRLGQTWLTLPFDKKGPEGLLFMPCLTADEVSSIIADSSRLNESELRKKCTFWNTVRYCNWRKLEHPEGEIFFSTPPDGYKLNEVW